MTMNTPLVGEFPHADLIRHHLSEAGLSQRGAARELGIDERTMRRYCAGDLLVPPLVILALRQIAQRHRNQQIIDMVDRGELSTSDGSATRERLIECNEELRKAAEYLIGRADLQWRRVQTAEDR